MLPPLAGCVKPVSSTGLTLQKFKLTGPHTLDTLGAAQDDTWQNEAHIGAEYVAPELSTLK